MSQEIQNPFAVAPNQPNGHHTENNPFHALEKATEVKSPFAGVGERSPFGLSDSEVGRPAKLPERKAEYTETNPAAMAPSSNQGHNPFEIFQEEKQPQSQDNFERARPEYQHSPMPAPMPNHVPQVQEAPRSDFSPQPSQNNNPYGYEPQPSREHHAQPDYLNYQANEQLSHQPVRVTSGTLKQLELRAIFGVNHELTREEIIQRARTLPGIRNVAVVGDEEAHALAVLKESIGRLGFGDAEVFSLNASSGNVDFIREGENTLAVLHEGGYAPGVRETLMIVTRELSRVQ